MNPMHRYCRYVWFVALLAMPSLLAQSSAGNPDHQIRQVLAAQVAAWNRGDIPAFMHGYANSPRTTFVGAGIQHGYASLLARYLRKYPNRAAMGQLDFLGLEVRSLGQNHAVVTGYFRLTRSDAAGGNASGVFSLVFEKEPSGWRIILDHTS